jgi:hypothetical protein
VIFQVRGSNRLQRYATTDANGNATMSYTSLAAGRDTIVAISNSSHSPLLVSNSAQIMWTAGPHVTFLTLNPSVTGATVKQSATVTASLADISTQPAAPIPGETITFTLGAATCSATTDGTGKASCPLSASQSGTNTLTAKFAGTSQFVAAADSIGFNVSAPPTPPPTVQISVSPANAAAGGSATLTWSSTGATACTASGSWSGSEPTGGTQTVTPATTGSFTYTLTCTGNGGSAAASAVLSATLVKITVTAKAGGGAMSVSVELLLGLLVMMRLAPALRRRRTRDSVAAALVICASALIVGSGSARAQAGAAASPQSSWLDPFYIGIRVGGMPVRMHAGQIDAGLNASGFSGVTAATDTSAAAGTMYIGYELASHADLEFGYTYRDSKVATLDGTIASIADVPALLRETTGLIRGYGNIFALSFRSPFELAPRFTIVPRVGAFVWDTKVTAVSDGASFSDTHRGGGLTAGVGFAYRVWQGLWIGVGADIFRGSPDNIATLYGGSIEWRFGR